MPRVLLALGNQGLLPVFDGLIALPGAGSIGNRRQHRAGDVLHRHRHQDAGSRSRRKLPIPAAGQKALLQQVPSLAGVVLNGPVGTVVVGDHQTLGRDEGGRATAQPDHGVHGVAGQVRQGHGIHLWIQGPQLFCQSGKLPGPPHTLFGQDNGRKENERDQENQARDSGLFHGRNLPNFIVGLRSGARIS